MKKFFIIISSTFAVALAVVIGIRISPDAMAVIIGIVAGVLASIPTSVILVLVLRQRDRQMESQYGSMRYGQYPPVVVVNGQTPNGYGTSLSAPALTAHSGHNGARDFKVVGQENTETVGDLLPSFWEQI